MLCLLLAQIATYTQCRVVHVVEARRLVVSCNALIVTTVFVQS